MRSSFSSGDTSAADPFVSPPSSSSIVTLSLCGENGDSKHGSMEHTSRVSALGNSNTRQENKIVRGGVSVLANARMKAGALLPAAACCGGAGSAGRRGGATSSRLEVDQEMRVCCSGSEVKG